MKLQLISFPTCPYVQRAVIALREEGMAHDVRFIDLAAKPDWFLAISPRGKVPVLRVDDQVLFESMAILEFIQDAANPARLRAADLVERARERAWCAAVNDDLFGPIWALTSATSAEALASARTALAAGQIRLEKALSGRDYLSGDGTGFGLVEVAAAPALCRLQHLADTGRLPWPEDCPQLLSWAGRVLARPTVAASFPGDYEAQTAAMFAPRGGTLLYPN